MSVTTQIRFLKDGTAGTPVDMLLPVFGGEILSAYDRTTQFLPRVQLKTIATGIHADFPATWRIDAERHEAGTELLGLDAETMKRRISLDTRPLVSHFEIDDIDEILAHFSVRAEFSSKMGESLANQADRRCAMLLVLAARAAASGSFPGGNAITKAATATADLDGAAALIEAIDEQVVHWDENDVPVMERYCAVAWDMWHQLRKLDFVHFEGTGPTANRGATPVFGNRDVDPMNPSTVGQSGAKPAALYYNGVSIIGTNNMPTENITDDGYETNYVGNYSTTTGIMWQKDAIGWLQKLGLQMETTRDVRRQSDFFVAKVMFGGGTLRPLAAAEVKSA